MISKKTTGPVIILTAFLGISSLLLIFQNKTIDIFSFFILLIFASSFFVESLITDLVALLTSVTGLLGMNFTNASGRLVLLGEIASIWAIIWLIHLLNDRAKYQQSSNNRELADISSAIENMGKELLSNRSNLEKVSGRIAQYKNLTLATKEIIKVTNLPDLKVKLLTIIKKILNCNDTRFTTFLPSDDRPPDTFDAWVVRKRSSLLIQNTIKDYRFEYTAIPKATKSVIAVPLLSDKNIIGIVRLDSDKENRFTQEDMSIISILVNVAEMTVENLTLLEKTKELSIIDGLTGVYVRKFFDERLQEEMTRASRFKTLLCLILCDIDHFKKFNDTYGHQKGDEVLKQFSHVLKQVCRETDVVARYGGEEFAVILPETSKDVCVKIAETIRTEFQKETIEGQPVTVSLGISSYPDDANEHHQLIRRADERLYKAKMSGRNRTIWKE
ncbi:MAG: sensor domain-containing diguanylate cyclase [Elusimicrobia bacterium]|nr:sensor domain-containing diguanylate cyclase [Elusimicrobiota bacterium]